MITEDYVSFETAKLMKEKGFNEYCYKSYGANSELCSNFPKNCVLAPTLQMAMKWLREIHDLHIEIRITNHSISSLVDVIKYYWIVFGAENAKWKTESTVYTAKAFDKYGEAAEAGIKYCLENLI